MLSKAPRTPKIMRKLIIGASIFLIFLAVYGLLKTAFAPPPMGSRSAVPVVTTPTPNPNIQVASTAPAPDPISLVTPKPIPASKTALEPLKSRVVNHRPDQFRKGAVGKDELLAIQKAIGSIPWSLNGNPEAAADEDYSAIVRECKKSGEHDLLADLIAEAVSNDYQPNNEAANAAYSNELNSDFENGHPSDSSNGKSGSGMTAQRESSVDKVLTPPVNQPQPDLPPVTASPSPTPRPNPAEIAGARTIHRRHHSIVRHKIVDAKTRLLELWHRSLAQAGKTPKQALLWDSHEKATKSNQP
jgi:hypothetical protein